MKYTKNEAIVISNEFLKEISELEKKYGISFNSDSGDIYLSFKSSEKDKYWDSVNIGWVGDESSLKVLDKEKNKDYYKKQALSKLSDEEKDALGLK